MLSASRRHGRLPIVTVPEKDELMSSWLQRAAATYGTNARAMLEQLGTIATDPKTVDWAAQPGDIQLLAVALGTEKSDLVQRSFAGIPRAGLMFVSMGTAAKTCAACEAEFARRSLGKIVLHRWKIAVALYCGRCGGTLTRAQPTRSWFLDSVELSGDLVATREDIFNIVGMTMYNHAEAPVVERIFRAIATPIYWPKSRSGRSEIGSLKNGAPIMWRMWNKNYSGPGKAAARPSCRRNFAAWPEAVQAIAAAAVKQLASEPAALWFDLKRLGLIQTGDTTIARRLFRD